MDDNIRIDRTGVSTIIWRVPRPVTMKCAVTVLVCVLSFALVVRGKIEVPPELKEMFEETHNNCIKETGVTQEVLQKAYGGNLVDDPKLKCFLKCMFLGLQAMDPDGTVNVELIEASLPQEIKEIATEALKKCVPTKTGGDLCQTTYDMLVCMGKTSPELAQFFE